MTKKKISVSEETYESLKKIKEERGLRSYEEALFFLSGGEEKEKQIEQPESLELILSEVEGEDTGKELQELFSNDNIEKKADINSRQVMALAKAKTFAERYNNEVLKDFIINYIVYSVSKDRRGRKEFVESFKAKILEPLGLGSLIRGDDNASTSKEGK
jgi:predicted CopG family antitoxin